MAIHFSILARRIPWIEEPGGLQSMGSQRFRHDWVTNTFSLHFGVLHSLSLDKCIMITQSRVTALKILCASSAHLSPGNH